MKSLNDYQQGVIAIASCYLCWIESAGASVDDILQNERCPADIRQMLQHIDDVVNERGVALAESKEDLTRVTCATLVKVLNDALSEGDLSEP